MSNLNELKEQELEAVSKLMSIRNKISDVERKELLPAFKKKYEGKYFKYKNCYSCPEKESDYWFMYIKIKKVTKLNWMEGFTFQTDRNGKVTFEVERAITESICQVEITKKEFDAAFKKMVKKMELA